MKLSIAMATYNGERFLPAQLHSFVSQSRMPDELVVSDDQSTDGTVPLLLEFQRHAPFLVDIQVNPARLGPTRNFDQALARTTGDLVLLSDQDDVWFDTKIASLEAAALANVEKACFISDALLVDGDLKPSGKTKMGQIRNAGLPATDMVMGCCAAFRRSLLDVLLPIPGDQAAAAFEALAEGSAIRVERLYVESLPAAQREEIKTEEEQVEAAGTTGDVRPSELLLGPRHRHPLCGKVDASLLYAGQSDYSADGKALKIAVQRRLDSLLAITDLASRPRPVLGYYGVIDERLERGVAEQTANGGEEEALHVLPADVHPRLEQVAAAHVSQVVLELIRVVVAELRQVDCQADCRAARRRVKTGQAQIADFN